MIGRAFNEMLHSLDRLMQLFASLVQNGGMIQAGRATNSGRGVFALPLIQSDVMVIPTSRDKRLLRNAA